MADPAQKLRMTYAEYLAFEQSAPTKHEFADGEIWAMSGGTITHARLITNVTVALAGMLRGGSCRPYSSDARIYVEALGDGLYPDVSVVCGEVKTVAADPDGITNPTLLVEVLSPTTEAYDRGKKFERYQALPSLKHYVLVAQTETRVEHYRRNDDGTWTYSSHGPGDRVFIDAIGGALMVDEVYAG